MKVRIIKNKLGEKDPANYKQYDCFIGQEFEVISNNILRGEIEVNSEPSTYWDNDEVEVLPEEEKG